MRLFVNLICLILVLTPCSTKAMGLKGAGVLLGGSWMNQEYEYTDDWEFPSPADEGIPGFVFGAFSTIDLTHHLSASIEALYVRKGFEWTYIATDENGQLLGERTDVFAAPYLSIPVTLRFELESKRVNPYCCAGIGVETRLSDGDFGYFDSFNSVNLSGQFGLGVTWQRFGFDVRYVRDLTSAADGTDYLKSVTNDGVLAALTFAIWQ